MILRAYWVASSSPYRPMHHYIKYGFYSISRPSITMLWWHVNVTGYRAPVVYGRVGSSYRPLETSERDWRSAMMALWRLSSTSGGRSSSGGTRNSTSPRRRTWCTSRNPRTTVTLTPRPGHVVLLVASAVKPPVGWTDVIFCAAGADITLLNVKWWNGVNVNLSGVATWSVRRVSG